MEGALAEARLADRDVLIKERKVPWFSNVGTERYAIACMLQLLHSLALVSKPSNGNTGSRPRRLQFVRGRNARSVGGLTGRSPREPLHNIRP